MQTMQWADYIPSPTLVLEDFWLAKWQQLLAGVSRRVIYTILIEVDTLKRSCWPVFCAQITLSQPPQLMELSH